MKKITQLLIKGMSVLLVGVVLFYWNAFLGNPISRILANRTAEDYIEEQYPNMEFEEVKANYNFKNGAYDVYLQAKDSVDTHFTLSISQIGKIKDDGYDFYVASKLNTWYRINDEYGEMVDAVFLADEFPYPAVINYGSLQRNDTEDAYFLRDSYSLTLDDLEVNGVYDVKELAKTTGNIVLQTVDSDISSERAGEILLEIKEAFDREDLPFYTISLIVEQSENIEENPDVECFEIQEFLYSDIYEEGLVKRVEDAVQELEAYNNELE